MIQFNDNVSDQDENNGALKIKLQTPPRSGFLTDNQGSSVAVGQQYTLQQELKYKSTKCDQSVNDQFTYVAQDSLGATSSVATVNLQFSPDEPWPSWKTIVISVCGTVGGAAVGFAVWLLKKYCCTAATSSTTSQPNAARTPIGMGLDEDHDINLVQLGKSKTYFDYDGNGIAKKTSWVSGSDAILAYDHNKNGKIDYAKEIVLTSWSKEAKTDFAALLEVFDSNKDKSL
ncbi:hypothetical protein MIDIC_170052 [Alphaproteobacteria bacterium]